MLQQSALDPQSHQAAQLSFLIWMFVAVCAVVWVAVMLVLLLGLRQRDTALAGVLIPAHGGERRAGFLVGGAVAATALIIAGLTAFSYFATHGLAASSEAPIRIRVRGYQWWWEVTYLDPVPSRRFVTANELHLPAGQSVTIDLAAPDVIHSFWVPNLGGKQDLIPGRANQISFTLDHPGIYRGQCSQFCGLQHAHMAMLVVVEDRAAFDRWRDGQIATATETTTSEQMRGQQVFTAKACAACHTVRGTSASGTLGPDLTHVGSRAFIAAGMLPTTRGSLAAWIADPQTIKPGNNMPLLPLDAEELRSVSAYLAALR